MVAVISVMLLNSETVPVTCTRCPSATGVGQALQKMKMPSEVAGSASASASSSCRKKPESGVVALEVADDDAFDRDGGARDRGRRAVALDVVDEDDRPAAR